MYSKFKAVLLMFGLMILLAVPSIVLVGGKTINQKQQIVDDLLIIADIVAQNSISDLTLSEKESVDLTLKSLRANPNISSAYVFSEDDFFTSYSRDNTEQQDEKLKLNSLLPIGFNSENLADKETLHFSDQDSLTVLKQIKSKYKNEQGESEESHLGMLVIKYDLQLLKSRLETERQILFIDVILSLILAFVFVCRYLYPPFCNFRIPTENQ